MWKEMAIIGKKLIARGLVESQFGNISIRKGDKMIITKTGVPLDQINENSIVELDINNSSSICASASSETIVHRTIFQNTHWLAIIHTHPMFSVIESMLVENETIVPVNIEGEHFLCEIPVVKGKSGTLELGKITAYALSDHKGVIVLPDDGADAIHKRQQPSGFVGRRGEQNLKVRIHHEL